jgi:cell filamentation protein, protein adenylyltransferase
MFQPQIQFTYRQGSNLDKIEAFRKLVDTVPMLPYWEDEIRRDAFVRTVHSTAAIEGNQLSLEEVERIVDAMGAVAPDRDETEIRNLSGALRKLFGMASEGIPADERLIRQLNRWVLEDVPGSETQTPGEYRRGQNYVQDTRTGAVVYTPPDGGDVPGLMTSLSDWLRQGETGLHPVLAAGIAHLELVAVHPFWDGNGRTARAVATYVMYQNGYHFRRFHAWETYLYGNIRAYTDVLAASIGDNYYAARDYSPWLEYFTDALASTLEDLRAGIQMIREACDVSYQAMSTHDVDLAQAQALVQATYRGQVTTETYGQAVRVSRATAYRHLDELARLGLLTRVGRGRASRYVPGPQLDSPAREVAVGA